MGYLQFDINRYTKTGGYNENYPTQTNIITVSSWPTFFNKVEFAKSYIDNHPEDSIYIHECWTASSPAPMFKIRLYTATGLYDLQRWNTDTNSYTNLVADTTAYGVLSYLNFVYVNAGGGLAQGVSEFNIKLTTVNSSGNEDY